MSSLKTINSLFHFIGVTNCPFFTNQWFIVFSKHNLYVKMVIYHQKSCQPFIFLGTPHKSTLFYIAFSVPQQKTE